MSWTYLLVNFFSILIPFVFSFHPRLQFQKHWYALFKGIAIVGLLFIAWDVAYTYWGLWGFNPKYLSGINLINLPLEEWLFFICIPYACLFTYHSLRVLGFSLFSDKMATGVSILLIIYLLFVALMVPYKLYTTATFILLAAALTYLVFIKKPKWLAHFYSSWLLLLIPFFIVNGVLTGSGLEEQVVWYNDYHNLGFRMGTIPVEDNFYGMLLILGIVWIYEDSLKGISN